MLPRDLWQEWEWPLLDRPLAVMVTMTALELHDRAHVFMRPVGRKEVSSAELAEEAMWRVERRLGRRLTKAAGGVRIFEIRTPDHPMVAGFWRPWVWPRLSWPYVLAPGSTIRELAAETGSRWEPVEYPELPGWELRAKVTEGIQALSDRLGRRLIEAGGGLGVWKLHTPGR